MSRHGRFSFLSIVALGLVLSTGCENQIGGGRQLDIKEKDPNNVYDAGPRMRDAGVIVTADGGVIVRDSGPNVRDAGELFNPFPNATVGNRCTTGDVTNWLVLSATPSECGPHGDILANGANGNVTAFAQLPDTVTAPSTFSVMATVCLNTAGCEQRSMEINVVSFAEGTGMTGSWRVELDALTAGGDFQASWCSYDDLRPGGASTLAGGIAISEISFYQSVKVLAMQNGMAISPTNVPIVQNRPSLMRVFVNPLPDWQNREVVARATFHHPAFSDPRIYEERLTVSGPSSETVGNSTFNFDIPPETLLTGGLTYTVGIYETAACVPENGDTSQALFPSTGSPRSIGVESSGSTFNVVLTPVRYNADGSGRLPDTSPGQVALYRDLMYAMYPVADLNLTVGNVLEWNQTVARNGSGWSDLLQAVLQHRNAENPPENTYYYGIFAPASSFGAYCSGGCVAGLGPLPRAGDSYSRGAIGLGFSGNRSPDTFVHEIGHALGRQHAPCGVNNADGNYPYNNARLGVWGFNILTGQLLDPDDTRDMMSYCDPIWVSDYTYDAMMTRIATVNQGFPVTNHPRTEWKVMLSDMDGTRWSGNSVFLEQPAYGQIHVAKMYDENGALLGQREAHAVPLTHIEGRYVLVPAPLPGTKIVDVEGIGRLPL